MNGEVHYEVVLDRAGKHRIWFSNAVREDLPASVASKVMMIVAPAGGLTSSDAGDRRERRELGRGGSARRRQRRDGDGQFVVRGEPFEIEIPFMNR